MDKEHQASHDINYIRQIVMNPATFNRNYSVPFSPRLTHPPIQPGLPGFCHYSFPESVIIISFFNFFIVHNPSQYPAYRAILSLQDVAASEYYERSSVMEIIDPLSSAFSVLTAGSFSVILLIPLPDPV